MAEVRHLITIVGCGPGSPEYLSPIARDAIERADVLVGSKHWLEQFPNVGTERIVFRSDIGQLMSAMRKCRDRAIVVMVSGDPGISSLAQSVIRSFGSDLCCVIPGISSIQVAFARLGLSWDDARIISAHGKVPNVEFDSFEQWNKIAVLAGGTKAQEWIGNMLDRVGDYFDVYVCENLTLENERIACVDSSSFQTLDLPSKTIVILVRKDTI